MFKRRHYTKAIVGDNVVFFGNCVKCNKKWEVKLTTKQHDDYEVKGMHIQEVAPCLSAGERELLISGICDPCFQAIFDAEPEDVFP